MITLPKRLPGPPHVLLLIASFMLAAFEPAPAQGPTALGGTVRDDAGRPLPGAQVVLVEGNRATLTDENGRFLFVSVPAGTHRLRVLSLGFAPTNVTVEAGEALGSRTLDIALEPTALSLPGVQVRALRGGSGDPLAVTQATSQLAGRELERELAPTLAQTLRAQPGVSMRSMGPAATMPVLRGLTGDRILVLQDGQRTGDLGGSADDHGVTIDPLAAQRIEVVRGPATLLYGNNALGGVINVVSDDIPTQRLSDPAGSVNGQTETAYPGASAGAKVALPVAERWTATGRLGGRSTGNVRIPLDPVLGTQLANTDAESWNGSAGVAYLGDRLQAGTAVRGYRFGYGLPLPPDADAVRLEGHRRELIGRAEAEMPGRLLSGAELQATLQEYGHDELDDASGESLQRFALSTRSADLLLRQGRIGRVSEGAWGLSGLYKDYSAVGTAALTPPAHSRGLGIFGFQEVEIGGGLALQIGGRFDHYRIVAEEKAGFGPRRARDFQALSGSAGLRLPLNSSSSASLSFARSFRAPTVEELFSNAAHAGTGAVELGNAELRAERGLSAEGVLRTQSARWNGQLAAYRNAIDNYVHLAAIGDTVVYGSTLPVLTYRQERATLQGIEGSLEWAATSRLVIGTMGDLLHAERADGTPLSFMPPARLGMLTRWDDGRWSAGGDVHHEFRQHRIGAADELPTPAHTVFRAHAALRFRTGGRHHSITLRAENLLDELHREATSRIKDFAPGPGRSFALLYRLHW